MGNKRAVGDSDAIRTTAVLGSYVGSSAISDALQLEVAIIGGGPTGLMAADVLSAQGADVAVYDRMATMGRKFLMAGRGGLNLTHSEPFDAFVSRYGAAAPFL